MCKRRLLLWRASSVRRSGGICLHILSHSGKPLQERRVQIRRGPNRLSTLEHTGTDCTNFCSSPLWPTSSTQVLGREKPWRIKLCAVPFLEPQLAFPSRKALSLTDATFSEVIPRFAGQNTNPANKFSQKQMWKQKFWPNTDSIPSNSRFLESGEGRKHKTSDVRKESKFPEVMLTCALGLFCQFPLLSKSQRKEEETFREMEAA